MEKLCGNFLKHPNEQNGRVLLNFLMVYRYFNIAVLFGKYIHKLYPYDLLILSETAKAAYFATKYRLSYALYSKLLKYVNNPKEINDILTNRNYSIPHIRNMYIDYDKNKVAKIKENWYGITSFVINCPKYEETINSFINCCLDVHKITKWFFIEEKLSETDKNNIKEKYPFFTFVNSINEVKTEYIVYIEDECHFYSKEKYIEQCMSILYKTGIGQCLFNKYKDPTSIERTYNQRFYYKAESDRFSTGPSMYKADTLKKYLRVKLPEPVDLDHEKQLLINQIKTDEVLDLSGNTDIDLYNSHIAAYYKQKLELGLKIGCFLLDNKIQVNRSSVIYNQLFYIKSLKTFENVGVYTLTDSFIEVDNPKEEYTGFKYNVLNPSLYKDDANDIWVNIRHVSFDRKGSHYCPMSKDENVKTTNTFGKLNKTTHALGDIRKEIKDCAVYEKVDNRVLGFEDMKIFKFKNQWCFVCTSYESSPTTDVLFGRLDNNPVDNNPVDNIWETHHVVPLRGDMVSSNRPEKNWMPILNGSDSLSLVYSIFPLHIVTFDEENKKVTSTLKQEWTKNIGDFRGSSCLIPYNDGYIYIIHEVYYTGADRNYVHRFVWLSKTFDSMKYSDPFFMTRESNIEYCNGLVYSKEDNLFYMSYGSNDKKAMLLTIPVETVDNLISNTITRKETYKYCCLF